MNSTVKENATPTCTGLSLSDRVAGWVFEDSRTTFGVVFSSSTMTAGEIVLRMPLVDVTLLVTSRLPEPCDAFPVFMIGMTVYKNNSYSWYEKVELLPSDDL